MKDNNYIQVYNGKASYNRDAYLEIEDDNIIFDCSDGEYGPIKYNVIIFNF